MYQTVPRTLDQIPANRRLVEELYTNGKISHKAKEYALNILYPANKWGIWISRLFLMIGSALVLCGVIYFFAFNWAKITPLVKLSFLQIAMVGCLVGAYLSSLERMSGKILLLSASVLTGIFMAVFGQIYQTGADAYQLFMMWSLLILGWTLISNFAPQWILWLVINNIFLLLWWEQGAEKDMEIMIFTYLAVLNGGVLLEKDMEIIIFTYLAVLNGGVLLLREYFFTDQTKEWMRPKWIRVFLTIAVLLPMFISIIVSIASESWSLSASIAVIGHGLMFTFYRFKMKDMWSLTIVIFSVCILLLSFLFIRWFGFDSLFVLGIISLIIFITAAIYLHKIKNILEVDHV